MDERIKSGDTIKLDSDKWIHQNEEYFVHIAEYKESSSSVKLTLEDKDSNIFHITVPNSQIIKVS